MGDSLLGFKTFWDTGSSRRVLVLTTEELRTELIDFQVEMIARNKIPGIIGPGIREKDGETRLSYDVSGLVSLTDFVKRQKFQAADLILIIDRIVSLILESKSFLLDDRSFVLEGNCIYVQPKPLEIFLLYIPVELNQDVNCSLKTLVIRLLGDKGNPVSPDNPAQELLEAVNSESFCLSGFAKQLQEVKNNARGPMFIRDLAPSPTYPLPADRIYAVDPEEGGGWATGERKTRPGSVAGKSAPEPGWVSTLRLNWRTVLLGLFGALILVAAAVSRLLKT